MTKAMGILCIITTCLCKLNLYTWALQYVNTVPVCLHGGKLSLIGKVACDYQDRHTVVNCAAQQNEKDGGRGWHKWSEYIDRVSILTGTTKSWFTRIRSSVMPYPNETKFTGELAPMQGRLHSIQIWIKSLKRFIGFFFFFLFLCFIISTLQKSLQLAYVCSNLA